MCLIDAASVNLFACLLPQRRTEARIWTRLYQTTGLLQDINHALSTTWFSSLFQVYSLQLSVVTGQGRKQKDKQKGYHYLSCCCLFTTNAEIRQIGAVSPGLCCWMPELSVCINIRAEFLLFTTVFLQHLRRQHTPGLVEDFKMSPLDIETTLW